MISLTDDEIKRLIHNRYSRERRARLSAAGLCINGKAHGPPETGKTKCTACLNAHGRSNTRGKHKSAAEYQRARRQRARETGLCLVCCIRVPEMGRKCDRCRKQHASVVRNLRAEARKNGMCATCRCRPNAPDAKYCAWCLGGYMRRKNRWCDECLAYKHRGDCVRRAA